jgi:hypothetical protein
VVQVVLLEGGPGGDAGTQQRGHTRQRQVGRDGEGVPSEVQGVAPGEGSGVW